MGKRVYPLLMKKGLELPPVLTIFTQGVMSIVFGFLGLLVAVPMLAAVIVPIKMLYVRDVVGDEVKLPGRVRNRRTVRRRTVKRRTVKKRTGPK